MRHQKRVQSSIGTERTPKHLVTLCLCHQLESAQKWFEDPGELIYEPDFESGMTIRKKTSPSLPGVKRKAPEQTPDQKNVYHIKCEYRDNWTLRVALIPFHCLCCKTQATTNSVSTHTDQRTHREQCELSEDVRRTGIVLRDSRKTFGTHEPVLKNVM